VSDRSQRILAIVKAKGIVSIGDVSAVVTDCSEKTIQRELLALVEQGVLKKEGERRWSTYRLA
jgi:DeoR/GlpR family transcriptional regulator of sugar metabolism